MKTKKTIKVLYKGKFDSSYQMETSSPDLPTVYSLKYSPEDSQWTKPGKLTAQLVNDGNGFTVLFEDRNIKLNYAEAFELELLLREDRINRQDFITLKESK